VEDPKTRVRPEKWGPDHPNSRADEPPRPVSSDVPEPETRAKAARRPTGSGRSSSAPNEPKREADRDDVLRESFPASDPAPVSPGSQ